MQNAAKLLSSLPPIQECACGVVACSRNLHCCTGILRAYFGDRHSSQVTLLHRWSPLGAGGSFVHIGLRSGGFHLRIWSVGASSSCAWCSSQAGAISSAISWITQWSLWQQRLAELRTVCRFSRNEDIRRITRAGFTNLNEAALSAALRAEFQRFVRSTQVGDARRRF